MNLTGWIPVRLSMRQPAPRVEWILLGQERLRDPFFHQTIQRQMMKPFHQLFRRETSMEELLEWTAANPGAPLKGIVYHMSRCGSTLIGQQLGAIEQNIVVSEPEPVDDLLRLPLHFPELDRAVQVAWLRSVVSALGQRRNGESGLYLKTDCWHIYHVDLIREAFPDTPWIFLYREPIEVMVSQRRMPATWTVPGLVHPARLKMEWSDWDPSQTEVYCARVLAQICGAGLEASRNVNGGLLVNYSELPEATWTRLPSHFGLSETDIPAMRQASARNAKSPGQPFERDTAAKRAEANDRLRAVTAEYLSGIYAELEAQRLAASALLVP